ncbi:MAG: hypothetical protein ACOC0X_04130 [Halobacteriota archaeon]
MGTPLDRAKLRLIAGGVVLAVALLHLLHERAGFPRLVVLVSIGQPLLDPRPLAFTVLGTALIVGVLATWNRYVDPRVAYPAGIVVMLTLLVGYVVWHLTGHGAFWPYHPGEAELHPGNPVVVILDHLRLNRWELASKLSELVAFGLLGYLYVTDVRRARR